MCGLRIGIPDLDALSPSRGIGRTVTTLARCWGQRDNQVASLRSRRTGLPVLRNLRWGLHGVAGRLDVLFVPDLNGAEALFLAPRELPSVTMVYDVGGLDCAEDRAEGTLLTRPLLRLALVAARRSAYVVAVSRFTSSRLEAHAPRFRPKAATVPLGVDHMTFYPRARSQARAAARARGCPLADEDFVVVYVGAEYARKDLPTLIKAFAMLRYSVPGAKLLKVGPAYSRTAREMTMAAIHQEGLAVGRDVTFVEDADDPFLAELYCSADVFASTSRYEGFGLPLLEAMACGLPAVVTRAGAFPEVGGDAAVYVEPGDAAEFARRLAQVAHTRPPAPYAASVERARLFSWERTARGVLDILQAAARGAADVG